MAVAFGSTSCSSGLVPKSKLLHSPETQYGFVPKHSLHGGKNIALRAKKPILVVRNFFSGAQRSGALSFAEHRMHLMHPMHLKGFQQARYNILVYSLLYRFYMYS